VNQIPPAPEREALILLAVIGKRIHRDFFARVWSLWRPEIPQPLNVLVKKYEVIQSSGGGMYLEFGIDQFRIFARNRAAGYSVEDPEWRCTERPEFQSMFDALEEVAIGADKPSEVQDPLFTENRLAALRPTNAVIGEGNDRTYEWASLLLERVNQTRRVGFDHRELSTSVDQLLFHRPVEGWNVK
jgi:hypothetical protein